MKEVEKFVVFESACETVLFKLNQELEVNELGRHYEFGFT